MESREERSTKKPYHNPELRVYGNIREITRVQSPGTRHYDSSSPGSGSGNKSVA